MLTSQLGIRLVLWMGETVPVPAPYEIVSALTNVEVTRDVEYGDGFQLTFTLSKETIGEYDLLRAGVLDPFNRVLIGVVLGAWPEVLMDGVIDHHQFAPSKEPGQSTLTVTGKDITAMLNLEQVNRPYRNQPDNVIVEGLLRNYSQYGLVRAVMPATDVPLELRRVPWQCETDLQCIQRLAEDNGFVFYIEPVVFGTNMAYWGPENRLGVPQPALAKNMGPSTNVEMLNFSTDARAPVAAKGHFVEPIFKTLIPIPPMPPLRVPPLAARPVPARRTVLLREAANRNPARALLSSVVRTTHAPEAVTGTGTLDTVRYGHVLRARKLVGVQGAGTNHDGNYYVQRVKHTITRGSYTQEFTLKREGTGALLPVVRPGW
jgi:hypothetical protein